MLIFNVKFKKIEGDIYHLRHFTSLFGTNGHLSNIVIRQKTVQFIDEKNDVQMMT